MTLLLDNGQRLLYQAQDQEPTHQDLSHRGVKVSNETTQNNIYMRWYNLLKNNGRGASLKPIKSLEAFTLKELNELAWLIQERLKTVGIKNEAAKA